MNEFVAYVDTQSPQGSAQTKSDIVREFVATCILQTADQFCSIFTQNSKVQLAVKEEKIRLCELRNQEMKAEHTSAIESIKQNSRTLERERADLLAQES